MTSFMYNRLTAVSDKPRRSRPRVVSQADAEKLLKLPHLGAADPSRAPASAPMLRVKVPGQSRTGYAPSMLHKKSAKQDQKKVQTLELSRIDWTEWVEEEESLRRNSKVRRPIGPFTFHPNSDCKVPAAHDGNKQDGDEEDSVLMLPKLEDGSRREQQRTTRQNNSKTGNKQQFDLKTLQGIPLAATKYMQADEAEKQIVRAYAAFSEIGVFL